jgi:hypothetical protein
VAGHGPPYHCHDGSAEDDKEHQDPRSAGMKPHDVVVAELDSLEEAYLRPSQQDEMRGESVVCREQEIKRQEERHNELYAESDQPYRNSRLGRFITALTPSLLTLGLRS